MSRAVSPSSKRPYGVARVVSVWRRPRSTYYASRRREQSPRPAMKRGPKVLSDEELVAEIKQILAASVFAGEGYRKIWARLRHTGVRTCKDRVLRLLRQHQLLSPARQPEPVDFGILSWAPFGILIWPAYVKHKPDNLFRALHLPGSEETGWTGEPKWSCSKRSAGSMSLE
jgi:hypothetical protein